MSETVDSVEVEQAFLIRLDYEEFYLTKDKAEDLRYQLNQALERG